MVTELQQAYDNIMQAVCAEDIFGLAAGNDAAAQVEAVKKIYRRLSKIVFPDINPDNREMAEEAFKQLGNFYEKANEKIASGVYGQRLDENESIAEDNDFVIKTRKREYHITSTLAQGDLSIVYGGECLGGDDFAGKIAVKIIEDAVDNDLAQNEIKVLKLFKIEPANQSKHLPVFLDQFKTTDSQFGIIMRRMDGYDMRSVRENERYKNGVPQKHMAWMLNRLLSVLGHAHSRGVIHGNIEPAHLMIRPKDHNLWLIDWSYAVVNPARSGDRYKIFNEDFSAPEIKEQKPAIPSSDLYSVGKCMVYILGGDIKSNIMPNSVDKRLQRFIQFFIRESPLQRAQDAWEMHEQLIELIEELWGPRRFLEFKI